MRGPKGEVPSGQGELDNGVISGGLIDDRTAHRIGIDSFWRNMDRIQGVPEGVSRLRAEFAGDMERLEGPVGKVKDS